jgi:hypothetical protein
MRLDFTKEEDVSVNEIVFDEPSSDSNEYAPTWSHVVSYSNYGAVPALIISGEEDEEHSTSIRVEAWETFKKAVDRLIKENDK